MQKHDNFLDTAKKKSASIMQQYLQTKADYPEQPLLYRIAKRDIDVNRWGVNYPPVLKNARLLTNNCLYDTFTLQYKYFKAFDMQEEIKSLDIQRLISNKQ